MSTADRETVSKTKAFAIFILLGLPILLCCGALIWWFGRQAAAKQTLMNRRELLVARGVPNDEEPLVDGKPNKHDQDIRDFLARWSSIRDELHEIAEGAETIWTPIEFDSVQTLLPRVQTCRDAARLLMLEYEDAVRRKDHDQAFHSLMAIIGVSRTLEKEPVLVSQLIHVAISGSAVHGVKRSIEMDLLTELQLQELLVELKTLDNFGDKYRFAIAGERAFSQPLFDDPTQSGIESNQFAAGARPIDALASLDFWEQAESIETENLSAFAKQAQALTEPFQRESNQASWLRKLDTKLTEMTIPALDSYANAIVRAAQQTRLAKIAIGARLFVTRNGRFPASLVELTSKDLGIELGKIQTASNQPFGFRLNDDSLEIWGSHPTDLTHSIPDSPEDMLKGTEDESD